MPSPPSCESQEHPGPAAAAGLARPSSGPIDRRLTVPSNPDGYRPNVSPPLGYPASTPESINTSGSPRSSHQPNRPSISSFQPPRETARLHPVGSASLLPRPDSPSSQENESPQASSQGDEKSTPDHCRQAVGQREKTRMSALRQTLQPSQQPRHSCEHTHGR
jgi:hypothetical protein